MKTWGKQRTSYAVFLAAYLVFAIVEVFGRQNETIFVQIVPFILLCVMILTIFWHSKQQDEVQQAIANQAYGFAFWGTFLVLFLVDTSDAFRLTLQSFLPLWAVPFLIGLIGYLFIMMRYR